MAPGKRNGSKKLLSNSRPRTATPNTIKSMSSKATRTLIRTHHTLQKQLKQAQTSNDPTKAAALQRQIESLGGLDAYQQASIQGQAIDRGGDSSRVLVDWLREITGHSSTSTKLRMLEVGSLRVDNACARSGMFEMVRIDLNSQHTDILQQDFMERPIPSPQDIGSDGFDVISLSLVVNYVPDAAGRGEMLRRTCGLLRPNQRAETTGAPGLFLVLPAPCVKNSRYLDEPTLLAMMQSLGYTMLRSKATSKLVYYYYESTGEGTRKMLAKTFTKRELRQGGHLNNFAIVFN